MTDQPPPPAPSPADMPHQPNASRPAGRGRVGAALVVLVVLLGIAGSVVLKAAPLSGQKPRKGPSVAAVLSVQREVPRLLTDRVVPPTSDQEFERFLQSQVELL